MPHNIAASPDGSQLFLTHSGPLSTTVSIFNLAGDGSPGNPVFHESVTVGSNPFGIAAFSVLPEPNTLLLLALALAVAAIPSMRLNRRVA
jgi:hypothetical protein